MLKTLVEAIIFVMIVMFLFLQDWRSTMIPAITIPVSLVGTFAFIKLLGFSINTLTLFGIVLATGLVVDDAIVVIENIQRHMGEENIDSHAAASEAMGEVTGAVVATSLVLVAVFVPVAFFPGTTGLLYQQFSLTIAFSIAISAFNSLTFTPSLSALLLRPERAHEQKNIVFRGIETAIHKGTSLYTASARTAIRFRYFVLIAFFLGLAATYVVYKRVPTGFVPDEDQGWFMVLVQGPPAASVEYTSDAMRQVEAVLAKEKDITGAFTVVGFSFSGGGSNFGMVFLNLADNRKGDQHSAAAVVNRLRGPLSQISDVRAFPFLPPAIQGVSAFGGFSFQVLEEGGGSLQELYDATQKVAAAGNARPDLRGLFSSYTANDPQFLVKIDREKARSLQVPLQQISDTLQVYMGSAYVNDFDFNNRAYRVYVQADQNFRTQPRDIRNYYVRSDTGMMIPLDNLVSITETTAPQTISHFNLFRSAEIDGSAAPGYSSGQALNCHARPGQTESSSRLQLRLVGAFVGRNSLRQPVGDPLRTRPVVRLSHSLGAIRELCVALHHSSRRAHGSTRRIGRSVGQRALERRLLPDRHGDADRSFQQERHFDRRVRRAASRQGTLHHRCCRPGGAHPAAPHPDDLVCLHSRRAALGVRHRSRLGQPQFGGHRRFRRHDRLHRAEPVLHPGAVCAREKSAGT